MISSSDKNINVYQLYLSKSSHDISNLRHGDLAVASGIVKQEGLLELSDLVLAKHAGGWVMLL